MLSNIRYNLGLNLVRVIPEWFSRESKEVDIVIEKNKIKCDDLDGGWFLKGFEGIEDEVTAGVVNDFLFFISGVASTKLFVTKDPINLKVKAYDINFLYSFNREGAYEKIQDRSDENIVLVYLDDLSNGNIPLSTGIPDTQKLRVSRKIGIIFLGDYYNKGYEFEYIEDLLLSLSINIHKPINDYKSQVSPSLLTFETLVNRGYIKEKNSSNKKRYMTDFLYTYNYYLDNENYIKNLKASKYDLDLLGGIKI